MALMNVPPPMAAFTVPFDTTVRHVAYGSSMTTVRVTVLESTQASGYAKLAM